jgi:NADPH2:quinone reductase
VDGVARLTGGRGVDIVIDSVGGALTGEALATLALNGVLTSPGYSAGRKTTIDVTDLIWKRARMSGFSLFAQAPVVKATAWTSILASLSSGKVKPIVARTYKLDAAADALRHLIDDRPFGRVVLLPERSTLLRHRVSPRSGPRGEVCFRSSDERFER